MSSNKPPAATPPNKSAEIEKRAEERFPFAKYEPTETGTLIKYNGRRELQQIGFCAGYAAAQSDQAEALRRAHNFGYATGWNMTLNHAKGLPAKSADESFAEFEKQERLAAHVEKRIEDYKDGLEYLKDK